MPGLPALVRRPRRARVAAAIMATMGEESTDATELLRHLPLLAGLSEVELQRIAQVAVARSFPKGARVFHEGDESDACYVVRSGEVRVTREHSDGRAIALATLGPGEIVGELAMLDGEVRSASVEALSDVELLAISAPDMRGLLERNPEITSKLVDRADPPGARNQRARLAAVVPDRPQPRRRCAVAARRRGRSQPHRARWADDPDESGRPRAAWPAPPERASAGFSPCSSGPASSGWAAVA